MSGERLRVGVGVEVRVPGEQCQPRPGVRLRRLCPRGLGHLSRHRHRASPASSSRSRVRARAPCRSTPPTSCTARCRWPGPSWASSRPRAWRSSAQRRAARPGDGLVGDGDRHRHRRGPGPARPLARAAPATTSTSPSPTAWPRGSRATPTTPRRASTAARPCRGRDDERRRHHDRAPAGAPRRRAGGLRARRAAVDRQGPLGAAAAGAPGRRGRQLGARRAARPRPRHRPRAPARRHPRVAAPGGPAHARTPSRWPWSTPCAPRATPPSSPGAGPSVLVLARARPGRRRARVRRCRAGGC